MVMTNRELDLDVTRTGRKRKQMLTLPPHPISSSPSLLQKQFRAQLSSRNKLPPDHSSSRRFQFSLQAPSRNLGETGKKIIRAIRITWPQLNGMTSCFFSKEVEYYRFGIGRWLFQFIPPRNKVFYILLPLQRSNFEQKRFLPKKKRKQKIGKEYSHPVYNTMVLYMHESWTITCWLQVAFSSLYHSITKFLWFSAEVSRTRLFLTLILLHVLL